MRIFSSSTKVSEGFFGILWDSSGFFRILKIFDGDLKIVWDFLKDICKLNEGFCRILGDSLISSRDS